MGSEGNMEMRDMKEIREMKAPYFFHKKVPVVPREGPRSSNLVIRAKL